MRFSGYVICPPVETRRLHLGNMCINIIRPDKALSIKDLQDLSSFSIKFNYNNKL